MERARGGGAAAAAAAAASWFFHRTWTDLLDHFFAVRQTSQQALSDIDRRNMRLCVQIERVDSQRGTVTCRIDLSAAGSRGGAHGCSSGGSIHFIDGSCQGWFN